MDWKKAFNPPFITVALLLLVALIGLQSVVHMVQGFLMKSPIALRQRLFYIAEDLGPYHKVHEQNLSREIAEELGTDQYISWTYKDTRLKDKEPGAAILLHVAYYTGTPDAAPHVPETCFVANGAKSVGSSDQTLALTPPRTYRSGGRIIVMRENGQEIPMPTLDVPMHVFEFKKEKGDTVADALLRAEAGDSSFVLYCFSCNGMLLDSPQKVSAQILDLTSRYAYWCKIEVQPIGVTDRAKAAEVTRQFLSEAMPEIQACLPDWAEVKAGRYPAKTGP